jgi:response regulator RpfG family c-di-GMP phosphodiesterase
MTETTAPARVLFVDDEPSILAALKRLFRADGYTLFTAESGAAALALLETQSVDVVVSDMRMPGMDGAQLLEQIFSRWPDTKRILLTGYADVAATVAAINRGKIWRYVAKPWHDDELRLTVQQALAHRLLLQENARLTALTNRQNAELKTLNAGLEQKVAERTAELAAALESSKEAHGELHHSFMATVHVFSSLIEAREGRLAGHARRVAELARRLAEQLGCSSEEQHDITLAALLHDIGKIGMPDALLAHPFNALTPADRVQMMTHPAKGQQLLMGIEQLSHAAKLIRSHHEMMDGKGYPDQLAGLAIPQGARILAVANDYDALQAGSLALHPHTPHEALEFLVKQRGHRYDPHVVDALKALLTSAAKAEPDIVVSAAALHPGMLLTRDLLHGDGYLLIAHGRVVDVAIIERLRRLEESEGKPLQIHIRRSSGAATLRGAPETHATHLWKEVAVPTARLKEGMTLARNLNHHDGYLLLARNCVLDEAEIRQIKSIETSDGYPITVVIRIDQR